jgi:hypothetical protein
MNSIDEAYQKLVEIMKGLAIEKRSKLEELKTEYKNLDRQDFIWHYLLQSFSTLGNSDGWYGLIGNPRNYQEITFVSLSKLSPYERLYRLEKTLEDAKVRYSRKKANQLADNFDYIQKMGGLVAVKDKLFSLPGRDAKIDFLKTFVGIGQKYARNILMDVYHDDFRDSIAIDSRIDKISKEIGLSFTSYKGHEDFYLRVAHGAGINGWELDRLMYNFNKEIISRIKGKGPFNITVIRRPRKCR